MEELRSRVLLLLFLLVVVAGHVRAHDGDDGGSSPQTLSSSSPCPALPQSAGLPFSTNNFTCTDVWAAKGFTLMHQITGPGLWSFVLAAPDQGNYIAVGFSPNGMMIGSNAIAAWIPSGGAGIVKQYYLAGKRSSDCQPDTGDLKIVPKSTAIVSLGSRLYLAFQLTTDQTPSTKLVFATGPVSAPGENLLQQHRGATSTVVAYATGQTSPPTGSDGGDGHGSSNSPAACASDLTLTAKLPFDTAGLSCANAWAAEKLTLFYKRDGEKLWSYVLSAPDSGSYVSMGFSSKGSMVGSNAIATWKTGLGTIVAKQYYLGGKSPDACLPDQGNLPLVTPPVAISESSRIYLAFQLNTSQPQSNLIYAIGGKNDLPGSDNLLPIHQYMTSTYLDYTTGQSSGRSSSVETLRKAHGLLGLLGWGVLVPIGVTVARYGKSWDPLWFYSHLGIQAAGFALGAICVFAGLSLENKLMVEVDTHKAIGIVILIMGVLQVLAVLLRPDKAAKIRKYWNFYHHNVGRAAIILAVANIFYGLRLAHEDAAWKIGFGIFLAIWVASTIGLEVWTRQRQ